MANTEKVIKTTLRRKGDKTDIIWESGYNTTQTPMKDKISENFLDTRSC